MKTGHWLALAVAAAIIAGVSWQMVQAGTHGFNQPPRQPQPDDDLARMTDPHPDHPLFCQPEDHHAGYTYTPHRYPRVTGGEITALIHRGFSPMRVPRSADVQWLIAPPSEVSF
jgi:uncharacterized membrane protein YagU involved in acid resistance